MHHEEMQGRCLQISKIYVIPTEMDRANKISFYKMFENVPFFEHAFKTAKSSNITTQSCIALPINFSGTKPFF